MKILAVKLREMGDTVIWTAALTNLKQAFPESEIHILTYASNAGILAHHPAIHQLHFLPNHSRWGLIKRLWRLRAARFDYLLGFSASTSLCRWAWLAGAKKMALHHHSRQRRNWGSLPVPRAGQLENVLLRDHRVVQALGFQGECARPKTMLTAKESDWAEGKVVDVIKSVGGNPKLPRLVLLPGAGHKLRIYPRDLWLDLLKRALAKKDHQVVVICDSKLSAEWGLREVCAQLKVPLFDEARLREMVALVSRMDRAIANDSGPGHLAVSLDVETTFLFGPGSSGDFHFYDPVKHPLLRADVACRSNGPRDNPSFQFCTVAECSHHSCMRNLTVSV